MTQIAFEKKSYIKKVISKEFGIASFKGIHSGQRDKLSIDAKFACMLILKRLYNPTLKGISLFIGPVKTHYLSNCKEKLSLTHYTSIVYGIKTAQFRYELEPEYRLKINKILFILTGNEMYNIEIKPENVMVLVKDMEEKIKAFASMSTTIISNSFNSVKEFKERSSFTKKLISIREQLLDLSSYLGATISTCLSNPINAE